MASFDLRPFLALSLVVGCSPSNPGNDGTAPQASQSLRGVHVASTGPHGAPSFVRVAGQHPARATTPEAAAREHLLRLAPKYGIETSDVDAAEVIAVHPLGNEGGTAKATIVRLRQRTGNMPVVPSEVRMLLGPQFELKAVAGAPVAVRTRPSAEFLLNYAEAIATSIASVTLAPIAPHDLALNEEAKDDFFWFRSLEKAPIHISEGRAQRIAWVAGPTTVPAYFVEFFAGSADNTDARAYRVIVDATTAKVVDTRNLTVEEVPFTYRVWADASPRHQPLDAPTADYSPHPTGVPDNLLPEIIASSLVDMEGFNRSPSGAVDPWLDVGATETRGNNVDAYSDDNTPSGFSPGDIRATTSSYRTFDWTYDHAAAPDASVEQTMAAVVELFYMNNWLHDYWYDSGFDEKAGNAQNDNYGRGGADSDAIRAEAQDSFASGRRNNANMSTPSDGFSPRMQMYAWSAGTTRTVRVSSSANPLSANVAAFGPPNFNVTAPLALADDGSATITDACEPLLAAMTGNIVLVDRGNCSFSVKAQNVQDAGADGMLLANNRAGGPPRMGGSNGAITIALLSVTETNGDALKAAMADSAVSATLERETQEERDGSYDHGVVSHEWGHYLHNRLADCGSIQCRGMGEGWGDFLSLFMMLREGDDLNGAYPVGLWAQRGRAQNSAYYGIRRVPYSVDPNINALSFRHIENDVELPDTHPLDPSGVNAQVHNTGEIWASMLLEGYVALFRAQGGTRSFEEVRRLYSRYLVAGLLLTPPQATFTEARDAILSAVGVLNPSDATELARAFARRGAGTCAIAPPRNDSDNGPVVESFAVQSLTAFDSVQVLDDIRSCDSDGVLDADERGTVRVAISNNGSAELSGAVLTVSSTATGLSFPDGDTVAVPTIAAFAVAEVEVTVALDVSVTSTAVAALGLRLDDPSSCETVITSTVIVTLNVDELQDAQVDDVQATQTSWTADGDEAAFVWRREAFLQDTEWHGIDFASPSDTWLLSPELVVGTGNFTVSFNHRYRFEAREPDASDTNWDGAVIEVSQNAGASWTDVTFYTDPGYNGTISNQSSNPLAQREGYVATSTAWPQNHEVLLDFGTALANETVQFRFRIGTDQSVGDFGWAFDDLRFDGITNTPFYRRAPDVSECPPELIADAGPDQNVAGSELVTLDGSGSVSGFGRPLSFVWAQTAGPMVATTTVGEQRIAFVAPAEALGATLSFELTVDDGEGTATDTVDVVVRAGDAPVADAGQDLTVQSGELVSLDGTASTGAEPLQFSWTQSSPASPQAELRGADQARPSFLAPSVDADTVFSFALDVSDGVRSDQDSVEVTVLAEEAVILPDAGSQADAGANPDGGGPIEEGDGCGCRAPATRGSSAGLWLLAAGGWLLIRRRWRSANRNAR